MVSAIEVEALVNQLVTEHRGIAYGIVREMSATLPAHVDRECLTSAALVALVYSAIRFEPERGVPFAAYARPRIRGAVFDELRSMDWASRALRPLARRVEQFRNEMIGRLGRWPTAQEVAEGVGISVDQVEQLDVDLRHASVLSVQAFEGAAFDAVMPRNDRTPEVEILEREQIAELHKAIDKLPPRLRHVVRGSFLQGRLLADIARDLGVTESRISQMRSEGVELLRRLLNGEELPTKRRGRRPTLGMI